MSYYENETTPAKTYDKVLGDTVAFGGRLTRDPELRTTQNGNFVVNIDFVFDNSKVEGGVAYASVTYWGTKARMACDFLTKGMPISGTGKRYLREYTKKDGTQGTSLQYEGNTLLFDIEEIVTLVGKMIDKRIGGATNAPVSVPVPQQFDGATIDDDMLLPF